MKSAATVLGLTVAMPILIGCSSQSNLPTPTRTKSAVAKPDDRDLTVVRKWLRENLDDSAWEEVRWWPAVDTDYFRKQAEELAKSDVASIYRLQKIEDIDSNPEAKRRLQIEFAALREPAAIRLCRLKYRSKNKAGANELYDKMFRIDDGRVGAAVTLPELGSRSFVDKYLPD